MSIKIDLSELTKPQFHRLMQMRGKRIGPCLCVDLGVLQKPLTATERAIVIGSTNPITGERVDTPNNDGATQQDLLDIFEELP